MEHLEHFGLARDPFRNEVQLEFWFASREHVDVGRRLRRCVEQGKELCVLVGEVGSGTTTVARALIEQLDPDRFEAGLLVPPRGVDPDALRSAIARQLGVESPAHGRSEAMRQLHGHLVALRDADRRAVIALDEAQTLSADALAELHALSNLEHDDARLLSIVLVGSPQLEATLAREPDLLARVELRLRLEPLAAAEARAYVAHRVDVAGGDATLFEPDVLEALVERAGGLPRRLNALADNTLFEAHLEGRARPARADVERAARDLPWGERRARRARRRRAGDGRPIDTREGRRRPRLDDAFEAEPAIESLRDADSVRELSATSTCPISRPTSAPASPTISSARCGDGSSRTEARGRRAPRAHRARGRDRRRPDRPRADGARRLAHRRAREDEDEITASRPSRPRRSCRSVRLLPDADELDGLFVDLVDEAEPES